MHGFCTHRGHGSGRRRRAREDRGGKVGCKRRLGKAEDCSSALEIAVHMSVEAEHIGESGLAQPRRVAALQSLARKTKHHSLANKLLCARLRCTQAMLPLGYWEAMIITSHTIKTAFPMCCQVCISSTVPLDFIELPFHRTENHHASRADCEAATTDLNTLEIAVQVCKRQPERKILVLHRLFTARLWLSQHQETLLCAKDCSAAA